MHMNERLVLCGVKIAHGMIGALTFAVITIAPGIYVIKDIGLGLGLGSPLGLG